MNLVIVNSTTTKGFVVMKAKGKELASIRAIRLAVGYTNSSFHVVASKNSEAFSCSMGYPESKSLVV